jgi:hypothetical protein
MPATPLNTEFVPRVTIVPSAQSPQSPAMQATIRSRKARLSHLIATSALPVPTVRPALPFLTQVHLDSVLVLLATSALLDLLKARRLYVAEATTAHPEPQLKYGVPKELTKTPQGNPVARLALLGTTATALTQLLMQRVPRDTTVHQVLNTLISTHARQATTALRPSSL